MIELTFLGPDGSYDVSFEPAENMPVEVRFPEIALRWHIEVADGDRRVSGMTHGAKALWGDEYWFEISVPHPATITYAGGNGYTRTDLEVA